MIFVCTGGSSPISSGEYAPEDLIKVVEQLRTQHGLNVQIAWGVLDRLERARGLGPTVLDTRALAHPAYPEANVRTPLIVRLDAKDGDKYLAEWFGPIAFVIATDSTDQSLAIARAAVERHGALTLSLYSTDAAVVDRAIEVAEDAGVALSINLTSGVFVNQSAAFSDFHGTGANPAANAALTDAAFVANRFRVVQHRRHA